MADGEAATDAHPRIEPEFVPSLVEVKTDPHDTEAGVRQDLHDLLRTATETAAQHDLRVVPFWTSLTETNGPATSTRGQLFEGIYGEGVLPAKNCAGSHIHFEKANVRRQLNLLTALDPALALVNSSVYYRGERPLDCSRAIAYRSGCGRDFLQFCRLLEYVDSVAAWEERTEEMYEDFCRLAVESDVSRTTVTNHFCAADTALNPVPLHQTQPTVEWRAPDSTLPSHVLSLPVDVGSLVAQAAFTPLEVGRAGVTNDRIGIPVFGELRRLGRLAIRSGCDGPAVSDYLDLMGFDVGKYDPVSSHVDGPADLSGAAARRFRITQSERLERDLQTLTDRSATDTVKGPTVWAGWAQAPSPDEGSH